MMLRGSIAAILLVTCVLACNAIAGINAPVDKDPGATTSGGMTSGGMTSGGMTSGGMTSGGPQPDATERFIGTWNTIDGIQSLTNCNNGTEDVTETEVKQTLTFTLAGSGLVDVVNPLYPDCPLRYSVEGDTAAILPGESCTGFDSNVMQLLKYTYEVPTTFTLEDATGTSARGTFNAQIDAQSGVQCHFEEVSTYTKPAP